VTQGPERAARRVLIVHNWHRASVISGENRTVEVDIEMLRGAGVEVEVYSRSNDEIADFGPVQWAGMGVRPIVSVGDARALRRHIGRFKPDVVHVHNVTPLLSPWVVRTARAAGVPVVQTVQNYLHECIAATYFRDGHPCHDCRGRAVPLPAVLHGCNLTAQLDGPVSGRIAATVLGTSLVAHRSTWRLVDRFVAVGEAVARHLATAGFDPARIAVRGNPVSDPGHPAPPGSDALFVGRVAESKGARLLVDAWKRSGLGDRHRLRFAGGGPELDAIAHDAAGVAGIEFLGVVEHERALALMNESAFVVAPGLWEEPFGLVVVEAMARARPALVTTLGEPAQIVDAHSGWVVEPRADALAAGLRAAFDAPLETMGAAARRRYEASYAPPVALRKLLTIYSEILAVSGT
jgi:glycosyltransferase involved in cell wall biosynthesis